MKRPRVRFTVELDLNPVPGFNHGQEDYANHLRSRLNYEIPWYRPVVSPAESVPEGQEQLPA
jgi:hypothetical protein